MKACLTGRRLTLAYTSSQSPSTVTFTEPFRASENSIFSALRVGTLVGTVAATGSVSANVDFDNGTSLQRQACAGLSKLRVTSIPRTRVNKGYHRKFESLRSHPLPRCRIFPSKNKDATNSQVAMATPLTITLVVDGGPAPSASVASTALYFG